MHGTHGSASLAPYAWLVFAGNVLLQDLVKVIVGNGSEQFLELDFLGGLAMAILWSDSCCGA